MKILRGIFLVTFVLVSTFAFNPPAYSQDGVKNIYLVTWRGFEEGCEGFKEYLDNRGLKYKLIHRDAARDKKKLPGFVKEIKQTRPDLVVTWGTSVSVGILGTYDAVNTEQNITDIPAVFMFPSNPLRSKLVDNYQSSGRNITGVRYVLTEEQQLSVAVDSLTFKKMGIVVNNNEVNVVNSIKAMKQAATKLGVEILIEEIVSSDNKGEVENRMTMSLRKLKGAGADLIYFPPSSLLNAHAKFFTQTAVNLGLPIFSSGQNPVRDGKAAIGVGVSYRQTGKRAAVLAEKILNGDATPAELSIDLPEEFAIVINMAVVNELNLKISPQMMSVAEIVQN
ncbi:MAG: ABC transporter substrate-binding protein [Rhodospirillaceae bacterium]|nr:ABC transporter substrate-binding protein [Rhodospirillaceae bacterium]MBT4219007.1 ABC transporter substrate-binding protein [Rhodospirillaceae bacterium]MBT4464991.1 ABC transporter substrate-binding protein [Rhodospirillaceae bacterium]MBT5014434.1 ABC transporter substrate-binding protein [Rhodospirillaceae bacterium]MBT7356783.1 ABC transporter substrate-binding protein [Rhodospirillaceae bacterium]